MTIPEPLHLLEAAVVAYIITLVLTKADVLKPGRTVLNVWYQRLYRSVTGSVTHFAAAGCRLCVGFWVSLGVAHAYFDAVWEASSAAGATTFLLVYGTSHFIAAISSES